MAVLLTGWEHLMNTMQISDYEALNPCECEGICTCEEEASDE